MIGQWLARHAGYLLDEPLVLGVAAWLAAMVVIVFVERCRHDRDPRH